MKKRSRKLKSPMAWIKLLDAEAIEAAREEALEDAYGDDEQRVALACMAACELVCPFEATVIGRQVTVIEVIESESGYSVDLTVEADGEQFSRSAVGGTCQTVFVKESSSWWRC